MSNLGPGCSAVDTYGISFIGGPLPVTPRLVERAAPEPSVRVLRCTFPGFVSSWGATPQTPTVRASPDPAFVGLVLTSGGFVLTRFVFWRTWLAFWLVEAILASLTSTGASGARALSLLAWLLLSRELRVAIPCKCWVLIS